MVMKKTLVIVLLIVTLVSGSGLALFLWHRKSKPAAAATSAPQTTTSTVNYSPATTAEKSESLQAKTGTVDSQQTSPAAAATTVNAVKPVIATLYRSDSNVVVSGYVPGIFEDGGLCTATFTQSSKSVDGTSSAFANATTTDCQTITIKTDQFSAGDWSVVLSYSSANHSGKSDAKIISL